MPLMDQMSTPADHETSSANVPLDNNARIDDITSKNGIPPDRILMLDNIASNSLPD